MGQGMKTQVDRGRWRGLSGWGVVAASAMGLALRLAAAEPPPNIVLILADDVGRETLQCYGGESYPTPNLNRLAAGGMLLEHLYVAPVCHPTRTTLLTGRYPVHLGYPAWGTFPQEAEEETLARRLQRAGYATAIAGKWQLTLLGEDLEHPHRLGFDTYCLFGWHEGPRYHRPWIWQDGRRRDDVADRYGPDVYVEFLVDFIRRHRSRPFLAFYSMALCHAVSDDFKPVPPYGPRGRYENFAEMMAAMDQRVGRLVKTVDRLGLAQRTLVFFLTDNGSPRSVFLRYQNGRFQSEKVVSRWRGRLIPGGKGSLADWGIRVPGILRWPSRIAPGSRSSAMIDLSDLLPTFCELAGRPVAEREPLDGRSFAALCRGEADPGREWVFSQSKPNLWCIRTRQWKLQSNGALYRILGEADTEVAVTTGEADLQATQARTLLEMVRRRLFSR